jgi:formate dehydrogenase subunit delta
MSIEDMVRMANQIAGFFKTYGEAEALKEAATHINNFWDPRMRAKLHAHLAAGGAGLDPLIIKTGPNIRNPTPA